VSRLCCHISREEEQAAPAPIKQIYITQKRPTKETYTHQKRPTQLSANPRRGTGRSCADKTDLYHTKETYKRDLYTSKETYTIECEPEKRNRPLLRR